MAFRKLSLGGVTWRRVGPWLDWALPLGFGLALVLLTPWRTALRFGMDEGFELMKALLVSQGHPLYGAFWNDQPPLHTELLALLFRGFGPSAGLGRLLSVGFAMLLVAALYGLARRGSNRLAGLVAVGLLVSSSHFLELSVSVMLELPAFALGLAAVWAWTRWKDGSKRRWLALSGALLACALQVKLTAALFLPAFAADFLAWEWTRKRRARTEPGRSPDQGASGGRAGAGWAAALIWLSSVVVAFGLITTLFYRAGAWEVFWASHFSVATYAGATTREVVFHPAALEEDLALLVPAAVGLGLLGWKRRRELLFPAVLLATVLAVHWQHRPYWPYYRLHFSIPLAWLGAAGIAEGFRVIWRAFPPASWTAWLRVGVGWLVWSLAVATALTLAPEKIWWELRQLRLKPPAQENRHVAALQAHAAGVRWVFTEDRMSAFRAGLPIPPELAVIPAKRLWSGQLTPVRVRDCLERYRPELVFLSPGRVKQFELADYLARHYQPVPDTEGLYRRLESPSPHGGRADAADWIPSSRP